MAGSILCSAASLAMSGNPPSAISALARSRLARQPNPAIEATLTTAPPSRSRGAEA